MQCQQCKTETSGDVCPQCGTTIDGTPKWYLEGIAYFSEQKNFAMAHQLLEEALQRYPDSVLLWYNGGVLEAQMNHRDAAIRCYQAVLKLRPNNEKAYLALEHLLGRALPRPGATPPAPAAAEAGATRAEPASPEGAGDTAPLASPAESPADAPASESPDTLISMTSGPGAVAIPEAPLAPVPQHVQAAISAPEAPHEATLAFPTPIPATTPVVLPVEPAFPPDFLPADPEITAAPASHEEIVPSIDLPAPRPEPVAVPVLNQVELNNKRWSLIRNISAPLCPLGFLGMLIFLNQQNISFFLFSLLLASASLILFFIARSMIITTTRRR